MPLPLTLARRDRTLFFTSLRRWRDRLCWAHNKLNAAPPAIRIVVLAATVLAIFSVANVVYQILRKPTEMLFPVSATTNKLPAETWRQYAPLFREYSTGTITAELLAALAQVEGAGNPIARTYWRWRLSWNPFAIYQPASSAVGMYQMTDAAFAEARSYCIRHHTVVQDGCWFNGLYNPYRLDRDWTAVEPSCSLTPSLDSVSASAGIISTVLDLAKYDIGIDRDLVYSPQAKRQVWTTGLNPAGQSFPYGLGWFVFNIGAFRMPWHYGWYPDAYSSLLFKVPDRQLTLILLACTDRASSVFWLGNGDPIRSAFVTAFLDGIVG